MRVLLPGGVELFHPFLRGGDDLGGRALAELDAGAVAHAVGGVPEVFEQGGDRLAVDGDGLLQFATLGRHAVDAAVLVVAVRVAHVVLHVADDDVVPVGDVERAVFAEDGVARAEVFVAAHEQAAGFVLGDGAIGLGDLDAELGAGRLAPDAGLVRVAGQVVVLDAEEADDVADQEVALHVLGEVRAADDLACGDGAHLLFQQLVHLEAVAFGPDLIGATAGAVRGILIAPGVKGDAVRVRRVVGVLRDGEAARIEAIHRAGAGLQRRPPGMLVIVHHEDTALPVDAAVGPHDEIVGAVVRVGKIDTLQQDRAHVGHVVAVGVLEEEDVRGAGDDDAAVPELEAERILHAGEFRDAVALAVLVVVMADDERVLHLLQRLPHRVGVPHGGPQAAFRIDLELHGVDELRELRLVGEQAHFKARIQGHVLDRLLAADVVGAAFLHGARGLRLAADIRDHRHRRRHVAVIDFEVAALGTRPDLRIAIARHHIQHRQLMLQHHGIGLSVGEGQRRAPAPDVVAVAGAVAGIPVHILLHHGLAQFFQRRGRGDLPAEQRLGDHFRELAVALGAEMHAVDRQRLLRGLEELKRGMEEIDKADARLLRGGLGGLRVGFELRIVLRAARQVRVFRVLMRDRAEEHEAREGFAVRLGTAHILHEVDKLPLEHVRLVLEGFVVAEEGEHDIRLHMAQVIRHVHVPAAAREGVRAVAARAHVAEAHVEVRQRALQQRFHPAIVLHAVGQAVAKNRDRVALAERKRQGVPVVRGHVDERRFLHRRGAAPASLHDRLAGLAVEGEIGELATALDVNRHRLGSGDVLDFKHRFARVIEQAQGEVAQPIRETLARPQADRVNRLRRAQVNLPPRIRLVLPRVRLSAPAPVRALVAIEGTLRHTAVRGRRLRGFPTLREVLAAAQDLDLGDLKALPLARNLDADETRRLAGGEGGLCRRRGLGGRLFVLLRLRGPLRVRVRRDRRIPTGVHLRLDAAGVGTAGKGVGLEGADEGDVEVRFDLLLQTQRPEDAVHQQAAVPVVGDVFRRAIQRRENAAFLARGG